MVSKRVHRIALKDIRPSQLYLSEQRLVRTQQENENLEPLPVKKIANELFLTDGHHRAFTLWKKGRRKVEVYYDQDDMDWLEYLICVDWCRKENIESISDLKGRVVFEDEFEELWIERCQRMHESVEENMFKYIQIEEEMEETKKSDICELVIRSLPDWFGIEKAILDYIEGVKDKYFLSVNVGTIPVGFISIEEHNEYTSEVYVLGIVEELHGRGIGRRLFEKVEKKLSDEGKKFLTVKTLAASHPDKNYRGTRRFYSSLGFYPLEEFGDLWDEDNPCLFMVKTLGVNCKKGCE